MSTLAWILVSGVLMSALALVGSVALLLPRRIYRQVVLPLVALAAGSLLGGALFHMLPGALDVLEDPLTVYLWLALGFVAFLVLEQFLHWHHCHRPISAHRPVGYLILVATGSTTSSVGSRSAVPSSWTSGSVSSPGSSLPPTRSRKSWATSGSSCTAAGHGGVR